MQVSSAEERKREGGRGDWGKRGRERADGGRQRGERVGEWGREEGGGGRGRDSKERPGNGLSEPEMVVWRSKRECVCMCVSVRDGGGMKKQESE